MYHFGNNLTAQEKCLILMATYL